MQPILESPAKLVFVMLALTACVAFLIGVALGTVVLETKDFMGLALAAFAFFFSYKGKENEPYAGK